MWQRRGGAKHAGPEGLVVLWYVAQNSDGSNVSPLPPGKAGMHIVLHLLRSVCRVTLANVAASIDWFSVAPALPPSGGF